MTDFFGQTLKVGDIILFNPSNHKRLVVGTVNGFTSRQVKVEYKNLITNQLTITNQIPKNLIKYITTNETY